MSPSRSWGLLSGLPTLSIVAVLVTTSERFRWQMRCVYHQQSWIGPLTVAACVLTLFAFAATLTFATEAAGNRALHPLQRFGWVLLLVLLGPVAAPVYWARHLRQG